jgi:hypothetical protein
MIFKNILKRIFIIEICEILKETIDSFMKKNIKNISFNHDFI